MGSHILERRMFLREHFAGFDLAEMFPQEHWNQFCT